MYCLFNLGLISLHMLCTIDPSVSGLAFTSTSGLAFLTLTGARCLVDCRAVITESVTATGAVIA